MKGKEEWIAYVSKRYTRFRTFETKEKAIEAGVTELERLKKRHTKVVFSGVFEQLIDKDYSRFYVGRIERPVPKITTDNIRKELRESAEKIYGNFCGDFMENVTETENIELENAVNEAVQSWIDKNALRRYGFLVKDVEEVLDVDADEPKLTAYKL